MKIQHVVTYEYPGIIFGSTSEVNLEGVDHMEALRKMPPKADAFYITEFKVISGRFEDGTETEKRSEVRRTGVFYPDGAVFTPSDLRALGQNIFADNVEINGYQLGVTTRSGRGAFFKEGDVTISMQGQIFTGEPKKIGVADV